MVNINIFPLRVLFGHIFQVSVALGEFGAPQHLSFLEDYVPGELSPQRVSHQDSQGGDTKGEAGKGSAEAKGR